MATRKAEATVRAEAKNNAKKNAKRAGAHEMATTSASPGAMARGASPWWAGGVRFECQGSGKCCVSRGEYGNVYVTLEDRRRMARVLGLPTREFTRRYCESSTGFWRLRGTEKACGFLKDGKCSVYEGRPTQCRTWPFWPETMGAKAWSREIAAFCPGVGKGRVWTAEEIREQLEKQRRSEERIEA